jgi:hypothetical protein
MPATQIYTFKNPVKYNESAVLLYLISIEINNLMQEIRTQSANFIKQASFVFTPEQIEAAKNNPTTFVKRAIATVAKRQVALNAVSDRIMQLKGLFSTIENAMVAILKDSQVAAKTDMATLEDAIKKLKKKEDDLLAIQTSLKSTSVAIDQLVAKHSKEWQQHKEKYVQQLLTELEQNNILLSELEKQELKSATKTINEVKQLLHQHKIL